jgi:MoaA/NifB/PqqE/SkfB family radical SAM enzyme
MDLAQKIKNYIMRIREKSGASFLPPLKRSLIRIFMHPLAIINGQMLKVMMGLTYRCQCSCVHCGVSGYDKSVDKELNTLEIRELINQITKLPYLFINISFFGGEPLLRSDIFELIKYASERGLFTDMDSNGLLLSVDNVKKLKESGLHHIYVSLDSAHSEKHDALRHTEGCYQKVIEGIRNCISMKLPCSVSTYASRENLLNGDLIAIIEKSRNLGVIAVRILYAVFSGSLNDNNEKSLSVIEKNKVHRLLQPGFVYLESPDCCTEKLRPYCAALRKYFFYISPYGELQVCPFVPIIFGNIRREHLQKIMTDMWHSPFFKNNRSSRSCLMDNPQFLHKYGLGFMKYRPNVDIMANERS